MARRAEDLKNDPVLQLINPDETLGSVDEWLEARLPAHATFWVPEHYFEHLDAPLVTADERLTNAPNLRVATITPRDPNRRSVPLWYHCRRQTSVNLGLQR